MHIGCGCVSPAQVGGVELEIRRGRRRPHERGADEKRRTTRDMGSAGPCAAIARWGPASHGERLVLRMQTHERSSWIDARFICIRNDSKAKEPPSSSLGYASTEHATARTRLLQRQITSEATCPGSEFSRQCGGLCSRCCHRLLLSMVDERRALVAWDRGASGLACAMKKMGARRWIGMHPAPLRDKTQEGPHLRLIHAQKTGMQGSRSLCYTAIRTFCLPNIDHQHLKNVASERPEYVNRMF
jgi:hypothetical protein